MEILRVPPYDTVAVNFVVPSGYDEVDMYARVTDMADLSVEVLESFRIFNRRNYTDISSRKIR